MSNFVSFPLKRDDVRVVYPDDIAAFSDVVIVGDVVHARYGGALVLAPSDYFRQQLAGAAVSAVKRGAFQVIAELDGEGAWRRLRADDKKALGDATLFNQLLTSREAVRASSNELETQLQTMSYDELTLFDPLPLLRKTADL
ncbi:MAG: hypothetical protein K2Y25_14480 [Pseudomonadaceae bacterium]|nr:hypothetical protein [Pseudomonadaceae bacterium]